MKITFPHMGNLWIAAKALFEGLDQEVVVPPLPTKRTLSLGARYSPESICLPLKINLGNYIEASELGADTIVMIGGLGPCRFGYYSQLQKEILDDIGYAYDMIIIDPIDPPDHSLRDVLRDFKKFGSCGLMQAVHSLRLAWTKCRLIDEIEQEVQKVRAYEEKKGSADYVYREAVKELDEVQNRKQLYSVKNRITRDLNDIAEDPYGETVNIAVTGEIYTILEPFVNLDMERHLGSMGARVARPLFLRRWINDHILKGLLPLESLEQVCTFAPPYLNYPVGGHGRETVGSTVYYARNGVDGVIQLAPLTCGPEIVAEAILPKVSAKEEIPVMTLYVDEHSGEAGVITRLEAFVDMIRRNKFKSAKKSFINVERGIH